MSAEPPVDAGHRPLDGSVVSDYRAAVDGLVAEVADAVRGPDPGHDRLREALRRALATGPAAVVLQRVPGGPDVVVERCVEAVTAFESNPRSSAADEAGIVRVLLLQQVDLAWWGVDGQFATDDDVRATPALRDLRGETDLRFQYAVQTGTLSRRLRQKAIRTFRPSREPGGAGMALPYARPELIGVLNEISDRVASLLPGSAPRIWVNSTTRSVSHQRHLQSLGFSAFEPSAHCLGWAADIEMTWYRRLGHDGALRDTLLDLRDRHILNVIDEGRAWHVCLNPAARGEYSAASTRR